MRKVEMTEAEAAIIQDVMEGELLTAMQARRFCKKKMEHAMRNGLDAIETIKFKAELEYLRERAHTIQQIVAMLSREETEGDDAKD